MKRILFFLFSCVAVSISAQDVQNIEPCELEIHYQFTIKTDTNTARISAPELMTLRIGKQSSQFFNQKAFFADSMMSTPDGVKQLGRMTVQAIREKRTDSRPGSRLTQEYLYKHYPQGKFTVVSPISVEFFSYVESISTLDWTITEEHKPILGYDCQQATCVFRGRKWTAWFTTEIPISEGPWKLHGLPGMILEAEADDNAYHYIAVGLRQQNLLPVQYYGWYDKRINKTDRITFLKAKRKELSTSRIGQAAAMSIGWELSNSSAPQYDFIERDYR